MTQTILLILKFISVWLKLLTPGGVRAIAAENIALRKQLIILTRHQNRAPKLSAFDRITFGILAFMINFRRLSHVAILLKPATLLKFHHALVKRKYHLLFSRKSVKKPGPRGPGQPLIDVIVAMKQKNPRFGHRRIAMQISLAFGIQIDKDVVRRVLNKYYRKNPNHQGPSWLTFIGHMKDSLWSIDLFRVESIHLRSHWVMVIMDQFTRRIIGFAVHAGQISGTDICCLFNKIISQKKTSKYLSSDNDPLFQFHRWQANLRILGIEEIKTVPYIPISHPFVERLIGTIRQELLDRTLYWNSTDLQRKLDEFQRYYNLERAHSGIDGKTPLQRLGKQQSLVIPINHYRWNSYCRGLFQLPMAA